MTSGRRPQPDNINAMQTTNPNPNLVAYWLSARNIFMLSKQSASIWFSKDVSGLEASRHSNRDDVSTYTDSRQFSRLDFSACRLCDTQAVLHQKLRLKPKAINARFEVESVSTTSVEELISEVVLVKSSPSWASVVKLFLTL